MVAMTTSYEGAGLRNAIVNSNVDQDSSSVPEIPDGYTSFGETDTAPDEGDNVVYTGFYDDPVTNGSLTGRGRTAPSKGKTAKK